MIEVVALGNRWIWRMICAAGRQLAVSIDSFATDFDAADDARAWRATFFAAASVIDHRQGACR